jgi:hypothetical protein
MSLHPRETDPVSGLPRQKIRTRTVCTQTGRDGISRKADIPFVIDQTRNVAISLPAAPVGGGRHACHKVAAAPCTDVRTS